MWQPSTKHSQHFGKQQKPFGRLKSLLGKILTDSRVLLKTTTHISWWVGGYNVVICADRHFSSPRLEWSAGAMIHPESVINKWVECSCQTFSVPTLWQERSPEIEGAANDILQIHNHGSFQSYIQLYCKRLMITSQFYPSPISDTLKETWSCLKVNTCCAMNR